MNTFRINLNEVAVGSGFSIERSARPHLTMKHIDGPVLTFRDGQMHWLTLTERLKVWFGKEDAESLERKLRPDLAGFYR
jgi:hypothetical protein